MKIPNVKKQLTAACRWSYSSLALNVYMFGEILADRAAVEGTVVEENAGAAARDENAVQGGAPGRMAEAQEQEFLRLMSLFLKGEPVAEALDCLREQVRRQMELITFYTDSFQVYEHVFNRLEARFGSDVAPDPDIGNDEKRVQWLMGYITSSEEQMTVNQRIQRVLGQLPVRLTKQKFFSMVSEALNLYTGSEGKNLADMMYLLRSVALLNRPRGIENFSPELEERLQSFRKADYKNMTAEIYRELSFCLEQTADMLTDDSECTSLLMDLINELYVLVLAAGQDVSHIPEENCARQIMASVLDYLNFEGELDTALLESLEGSQEAAYEEWETCATPFDLLEELLEECSGQAAVAELLYKIGRLLSTSSFMSLEFERQKLPVVDANELERVTGEFVEQLSASWEGQPRLVVRAVMAQIFSTLPVCFGSLEEVERYIRGCLDSCTDEAEKAVSLYLIRQLAELDELDFI